MSPSFDELLAHGTFLRGLAHALLRDEQGAEDVVQDAYVAALRHPPAQRAPRAWLAAVVRNLAFRRRRTESRRGQRERATARTEGLPSTTEVAAQVELQEKVAAAVNALSEPYRSAVVLRFYYGRTPTEIAGEQDVPVETVKTRLKRAIGMLRARLDETVGKRTWAPLLGVLLTKKAAIPVGVVLMAKKTMLAVTVVLLLAGVSTLYLFQRKPPAPERASVARGATPIREEASAVPGSEARDKTEVSNGKSRRSPDGEETSRRRGGRRVNTELPSESEDVPRGRIIGARGGAVPGVHVVMEASGRRIVTFSSIDGTFPGSQKLEGPVRVGFATWPAKENYYRKTALPVYDRTASPVYDGIEQGASGLPTLHFEGMAGQVLDADEKPVSEGFVVARLESDRTIAAHAPIAGSGWFAFHGLTEGNFHLSYKPGSIYGWEHAVEGGRSIRGGTTDVLLRVGAGDAIEGVVFDPLGAPAAQIYVRAELGPARTGGYTDAGGRYRIEKLEPGSIYRLTVWATGFVPDSREVPAGAKDVRFTLDPGLEATGRILDRDGKPKSVAQLLVQMADGRRIRSYPAIDKTGRFHLRGLPEGEMELWAISGGNKWVWRLRAGDRDVSLRPTIQPFSPGGLKTDATQR